MKAKTSEYGNSMILRGVIALSCLGGIYFVISLVYSVVSILGPLDHPKFEDKNWIRLFVNYDVVESQNKKIRRTMDVNGSDLFELKKFFLTKESCGISIANQAFLCLDTSNGERWDVQFGTPNSLRFCYSDDNYYAYSVQLEDTKFFEKVREICWKNELINGFKCKLENIRLCTNYRVAKPSSLPNPQSKFIGIDLRGELEEICIPCCDNLESLSDLEK
jgi:hypothetical protein